MEDKHLTKFQEKAYDKGRKKGENESFGNTTILRFLQPRPPKTMRIDPSKQLLSYEKTVTEADTPTTLLDRWRNCFNVRNITLIFADLLTVERSKARYEHGEIAHIENVMATERRERKHTDTRSTETYFLEEVETIREEERELETTDRFELERETERATQEELSFQAGVSVSVNYPFVNVNADMNFGYGTNSQTSTRESQAFSKEMVDRAAKKLSERIRTVRETRRRREIIEENTHGFDNSAGDRHRCGIYRWVDKVYELQIKNHGPHLLADLMLPDPAAVLRRAYDDEDQSTSSNGSAPPSPAELSLSSTYSSLSQNYNKAITEYGADLNPPPASTIVTMATISVDQANATSPPGLLTIPAEKQATQLNISMTVLVSIQMGDDWDNFTITVVYGGYSYTFDPSNSDRDSPTSATGRGNAQSSGHNITGPIYFVATGDYTLEFTIGVSATCEPTQNAKNEWVTATWEKINAAYNSKLSEYEAQVEIEEEESEEIELGSHPLKNQILMREELKRLALYFITGSDLDFDRSSLYPEEPDLPSFAQGQALLEGELVRFLEQVFDWSHMTYLFYPYFWAKRDSWLERIRKSDRDPEFEQFLKAGYARLVIPIRKGFETAVLNFIQTGCPGAEPPSTDPNYLPIAEEIRLQTQDDEEPVDVGDPWSVTLPTSLIMLQSSDELNMNDS